MAVSVQKAKVIAEKRNEIINKAIAAGFAPAVVPALLDLLIAEIVEAPEIIRDRHLVNRGVCLDTVTMDCTYNGQRVPMTPMRLHVLEYFLRRQDQTIPFTQAMHAIWGQAYDDGNAQYLRVFISQLRKITHQQVIESVPGIGYIMRRVA